MNDTDVYGFSLKKYGFPPRNCGVSGLVLIANTSLKYCECKTLVAKYKFYVPSVQMCTVKTSNLPVEWLRCLSTRTQYVEAGRWRYLVTSVEIVITSV